MTKSPEALETSYRLFKDYCNQRDRIKVSLRCESVTLTQAQAARVLTLARQAYRKRELANNTRWFIDFLRNTNLYFDKFKINSWWMLPQAFDK